MTEIEPGVSIEEEKVKRKRVLLLTIIGIVIVVGIIAAYFILGELLKPPLPDPNELLSKSINAHKEVKTYHYEIHYKMEMETDAMKSTINLEGEGKVNLEKRKAYMLMRIKMPIGKMEQEMYIINDTLYQKIGRKWYKLSREGVWEQREFISSSIRLLKKLKLRVTKVERVRGKEAYVLEATSEGLSEEELTKLVMETSPATVTGVPMGNITIKSLKISTWIDKQKYYTLRVKMSMTMHFKLETRVTKSDIEFTMDILGINTPITIELPPEAERAEPMPIVPPREPS